MMMMMMCVVVLPLFWLWWKSFVNTQRSDGLKKVFLL